MVRDSFFQIGSMTIIMLIENNAFKDVDVKMIHNKIRKEFNELRRGRDSNSRYSVNRTTV